MISMISSQVSGLRYTHSGILTQSAPCVARSSLQQRVVSWLERPPQVRTVEPPSDTEKWSASQMGRGGPGHWV